MADTPESFKAELLADAPSAVQAALDAKAQEFMEACLRYVLAMKRSGDPFAGIRHLAGATATILEAQKHLDRENIASRKPKGTAEAFPR